MGLGQLYCYEFSVHRSGCKYSVALSLVIFIKAAQEHHILNALDKRSLIS